MNSLNSVVAVRVATQAIKNEGIYFAGELVQEGFLGLYKAKDGHLTLVYLEDGKEAPLREVVIRAEGGYRVASPHFAGHVDGHKFALIEEAAAAYWDSFGGKIIGVIPFKTLEAEEMEIAAKAVVIDQAVVDAVVEHILLDKIPADAYKPFLHEKGHTHVLVRHNGMYAVFSTNYQNVVTEWNYPNLARQVATGDFAENMISLTEEQTPQKEEIAMNPLIEKIRARNAKVVAGVLAAGGLIKDGHNGGRNNIQLSHVAVFGKRGHKEHVVALLEGKLFCINPVELNEDGSVELSTCSVGGNVMNKEDDMADRIADYSDFDKNTLWDLVRVDGK
ncbi:hypothetical protein D3C71_376460 [compost metagenome]